LQTRLFFPIQSLLSVGVDVQSSLALFERVFEYLELPVEIKERDGAVKLDPGTLRGDVAFTDVGFRYAEDGPWTLRDIDLEIPAGSTLAVVGETGSGKTTLAYLLARLYEVSEGSVTIDGVDVRDLGQASLASTVPTDVLLDIEPLSRHDLNLGLLQQLAKDPLRHVRLEGPHCVFAGGLPRAAVLVRRRARWQRSDAR